MTHLKLNHLMKRRDQKMSKQAAREDFKHHTTRSRLNNIWCLSGSCLLKQGYNMVINHMDLKRIITVKNYKWNKNVH